MKTEAHEVTAREFEYPYDKSLEDIKRYHESLGEQDASKAFFLHKDDLLFLIGELMNIQERGMGVRCYPARREDNTDHLLLVAVAEDDAVMYPHGKDLYSEKGASRIFDLTRPCPDMCDPLSSLFLAAISKAQVSLESLAAKKQSE